jgi:hypothetical protein
MHYTNQDLPMPHEFCPKLHCSIILKWVHKEYQSCDNLTDDSFPVGFEILTVVSTKMGVFWVVAPCSLV